MTNYKWKRKPKNAPEAKEAFEFIEKIRKKKGGITPQLLVIESKAKKSLLHNCFEWDDTKAAEQHRISQAREILRYIVVEIEPEDEEEEPLNIRAYIAPSDIKSDSSSYVTIEQVCNDDEMESAYIEQLKQELRTIKNKIKFFKIFTEVVRAIENIK